MGAWIGECCRRRGRRPSGWFRSSSAAAVPALRTLPISQRNGGEFGEWGGDPCRAVAHGERWRGLELGARHRIRGPGGESAFRYCASIIRSVGDLTAEERRMHSKADQLELIGLMAANELAVGEIYEVCAKLYPSRAKLFKKLAEAEQEHARSITGFSAKIKEGLLRIPPDRLDAGVVMESFEHVQELLKQVRQGGMEVEEALDTCAELEETLLEKHGFDIMETDSPELKLLLEKLSADTAEHREELRRGREGEGEASD